MSEKLISLYTNQLKKIFLAEKTFLQLGYLLLLLHLSMSIIR